MPIYQAAMMSTYHSHAYLALNSTECWKQSFSENSGEIHKKERNMGDISTAYWRNQTQQI